MVLIHIKRSDKDSFAVECSADASNDAVIRELCSIWNLREKLACLASMARELAAGGSVDDATLSQSDGSVEKQDDSNDELPPRIRRSATLAPAEAEALLAACKHVETLVVRQISSMDSQSALSELALRHALELLREALQPVTSRLAGDDPIRMLVEDDDDARLAEAMGNEYMVPESAELWWAGKEFRRDQLVRDRAGRNEKTKLVAKLQRKGGGPPVREPVVSEEERKAMMAWYFKKQEAEKALAEDRDDSYLNARWADSRALKSELLSTSNINWRSH